MTKLAVTIFLALVSAAMAFPANNEGNVRVARGIFDAGFNAGLNTHIGHYPSHGHYNDGYYPGGINGGYPGGINGGYPSGYNGAFDGGYYPNQGFGGPGFGGPGFGGPAYGNSNTHAEASASSNGGGFGGGSAAQANAGSYSG